MENKIIVKNLHINYKTFGAGKPFLILHGWGSKSDRWEKLSELLAQQGLQVFVPDLPGFGKSQEPEKPWSLDTYVEWLNEFVEKVPELRNGFYLMGHSFGGAMAAKFTIKYNQKVAKLFLVSSACIRKRTAVKKAMYQISKAVKLFSFLPYYPEARKAFYKFVIRTSDYPYVSGVMKETYLKVISDDGSHKINFIKVPTTIIWGDKDDYTPIDQAKFIHSRISNSNLVIIPGAGHALQIKFPEMLAEKIIENV